jgi:hypothetical protein
MIEVLNLENLIPVEFMYAMDEGVVKSLMASIVEGARDHWITLARKTFHTTKQTYIEGIQEIHWLSEDTAVISLVGVLPNMLEQGSSARDLHDVLLGPNVPVSPRGEPGKHPRKAGGFYRSIPFRHRTPGQGAHGTPMGQAHEKMLGTAWSKQLGKDVYRAAKKLEASVTDPYTKKTKWGGRLDSRQVRNKGEQVYIPKLKAYHSANPYQGMVRMEKKYDTGKGSSFMTFRTISVDAGGQGVGKSPWIRPGRQGSFLAKQVAEHVGTRLAPQAFEAYVRGLR